jgi:prepilin-type N-terminal cleavage/methylation domain-containing protein
MKTTTRDLNSRPAGFTLIELLVVIAVIAVLASLIFPITGALKKQRTIKVAQTELGQVATAIDAYHSKYGHYPPDNPNPTLPGFLINQLYYELKGAVKIDPTSFQALDGGNPVTTTELAAAFGPVIGFVNSSASKKGDDDQSAAINFLKDLKPNQSAKLPGSSIEVLTCSILWDNASSQPIANGNGMNPWRYVSTHPTNNPNSYDLWVDVLIGGKTNRISNWSTRPQIVP